MTNTSTSSSASPKSNFTKIFWIIGIVLGLLGIDHYTFNYVSGGVDVAVTVTDSTIVADTHIDTTITIAKSDSAKADTTKK